MNVPAFVDHLDTSNARLPIVYEAAKTALANCASIDECKDWADKAQALASYARQSEDATLEKFALRIRARATRRCGELLKQFNTGPKGGRPKNTDDAVSVSQRQAAHDAGIKERQQVTAVRVANVPAEDFDRQLDSNSPPSLTKLAEQGKAKRPDNGLPPDWDPPPGFAEATQVIGDLRRLAEACRQRDPEVMAKAVMPKECQQVRSYVATIDGWLDRFVVNLRE